MQQITTSSSQILHVMCHMWKTTKYFCHNLLRYMHYLTLQYTNEWFNKQQPISTLSSKNVTLSCCAQAMW